MPQATRDLHLRGNWNVVDGNQQVARTNTGAGRRGVWSQLPSLSTVRGIQPGYTVIRSVKSLALDEVQPGKDHCRQRGKRQDDGSETDPQILLHGPRGIHPDCKFEVQTDVHLSRYGRTRNCNAFLRLGLWRGGRAAGIHFMEGCLQLSEP